MNIVAFRNYGHLGVVGAKHAVARYFGSGQHVSADVAQVAFSADVPCEEFSQLRADQYLVIAGLFYLRAGECYCAGKIDNAFVEKPSDEQHIQGV
ncbi:hypothetical protein SDC9_131839 [bioreactor metagenome]|uniref:Uncharacterized protein n=1 Tax=bioreactor metagenome TaxID=1076179 RepID=A0A645D740_9ZZZZ